MPVFLALRSSLSAELGCLEVPSCLQLNAWMSGDVWSKTVTDVDV